MSNLLHELENNEAILLMYLAGELPEEDRLEVEQMLAGDPALRLELAELEALHDQTNELISRADGPDATSRREAMVRQVSRALAAHRLEPLKKEPTATEPARSRLRIAWWAYPIAAAAALVIGMMLLSDQRPMNLPAPQSPEFVDGPATTNDSYTTASSNAQIFPAELERELISLNSDGPDLFTSNGTPDTDR